MKEHKTISNWPEEKFDNEINGLVSDGWVVDSRQFGLNEEGGLLVAFLSREVPTVQETPPSAYYTEDQVREAYADGWFAGNKNNAAPVNSNGWPLNYCRDKFMANLPKSRDYVNVPGAGENPTKDQYWECWKKAVGTEVGGDDYLRFLSWYKTLHGDNDGN